MPDFTQELAFDELADGTLIARLTLRFPNGASRSFAVPFGADDGARAAGEIADREGGQCVPVVAGLVGALAADPAHWWWRLSAKTRAGKRPDDEDAIKAWWEGLGRSSRSTVRALHAESPPGSAAEREAWWGRLGKKRRKLARERHGGPGTGFLADVVKVVKDVDRAIDKSPLGIAAQIALPVLALGRWSVKNPAAAASFIPGGSTAATAIKTGVALLPAAKKLAAGKVMEAAASVRLRPRSRSRVPRARWSRTSRRRSRTQPMGLHARPART